MCLYQTNRNRSHPSGSHAPAWEPYSVQSRVKYLDKSFRVFSALLKVGLQPTG